MERCLTMTDTPHQHDAPMAVDHEDRRLLSAFARQDDRGALETLLIRHASVMFRVAVRASGNAADAEDAVQEACLDAMRAARSFRGQGSVRGWLLAAVRNRCRMRARGAERRRQRETIPPPPPSPPMPDDLVEAARAALATLPPHEREVIELRCIDGLGHAEIAVATGRREATVRKQVERGLARLRTRLDRAGYVVGAGSIAAALLAQSPPTAPSAGLTAALTKASTAGPSAALAAGLGVLGTTVAAGLALAALGGAGWWALVPRGFAAVPLADPAPLVVAVEPAVITVPVTVRLHQTDIGEVMDLLQEQAVFTAVTPPAPYRIDSSSGKAVVRHERRPPDVTLVAEGVPLRQALDGLASSGWSWGLIAGRVCVWKKLAPARLVEAGRRLSAKSSTVTEREAAASELVANRDPDGLRALLAAIAAEGEPGAAARSALDQDRMALQLLADDPVTHQQVAGLLARAPDDHFLLAAAGLVRAETTLPRLYQALTQGAKPLTPVEKLHHAVGLGDITRVDAGVIAARALGWMRDGASRLVLEQVARDSPHDLQRVAAREALADLADQASLPVLLALLRVPGQSYDSLGALVRALMACSPPAEQAGMVREIFTLMTPPNQYLSVSMRGIISPEAWMQCLAVLGDQKQEVYVRRFACTALATASDRADIRAGLLTALEGEDPLVADAALRALAVRADQVLVDLLIARMDLAVTQRSNHIEVVTGALGRTRMRSAAEALLARAIDPQKEQYARFLIAGAVETRQPLVRARVRALLEPRWPAKLRSHAATYAVGEDPVGTGRLIEALLVDPATEVRAAAVNRLWEPIQLDRSACLKRASTDPEAEVREAAAYNIGRSGLPPAELTRLLLPLVRDPKPEVRFTVAGALPLDVDDDALWQAVESLGLGDSADGVRRGIAQQVTRWVALHTEHPRAVQGIELLSRMRADPNADNRREAQSSLDVLAPHHPLAARRAKETVAPATITPAVTAPSGKGASEF